MKILGIICARGGSKGVPNKNIRELRGIPLITHSIRALKAWERCDDIICSSDSKAILDIARKEGIRAVKRPNYLAVDTANKINVWKHIINYCEGVHEEHYDYVIDLDPTSPLRTVFDIDEAFNKFIAKDADIIYSVKKASKNPYFNMVELYEDGTGYLCKVPKNRISGRQRAPKVYDLNGSIYIMKTEFLKKMETVISGKNVIYEMSNLSIDIDREIDFEFIEFILKEGLFKFDY